MPDEPVVDSAVDEPVEIIDPDTPLSELPQTGVLSIYNIFALTGAALIALGMAFRLIVSVYKKHRSKV